MYTYLRDQKHYEDRYDDSTISICRSGEEIVNKSFAELERKLPKSELEDRKPGWYLQYSLMYFYFVEFRAAKRYAERDQTITKWMNEDKEKDDRIAAATPSGSHYCTACGKDMKIISKDYMHREGYKDDDILFMFECIGCNKRKAYWQDGTAWEGACVRCDKCGSDMNSIHKTKDKVITTTFTCSSCNHSYEETLDLSDRPEKPEEDVDPSYELDRKRFVFDNDIAEKYNQKVRHLERLQKLNASTIERTEHADIYGAIKDIEKLKIAKLTEVLENALAKINYSGLKLGEPDIGREVSIDFSCLDGDDDREEYDSRKQLKRLIDKTLLNTNWRLMSEGVSYRLGYLSGRLRAYESEEDLKKLVEQRIKKGTLKPKMVTKETEQPTQKPDIDLREHALVYMDQMYLDSMPAEVTLKSGKVKKTSIPFIRAEMNPLLRVIIPMRDNDKSVPKFIRNFDFKMSSKDKTTPKVTEDSLGREIRRL